MFAASSGGTVVLVGQDGVQRPPIHFPKGGHLLAFLSCLENGLLPRGQLDPPLWSQRDKGKLQRERAYYLMVAYIPWGDVHRPSWENCV